MIALIILVLSSYVLLLASGRRAIDGPGRSQDPEQRRVDREFKSIVSHLGPLPTDLD